MLVSEERRVWESGLSWSIPVEGGSVVRACGGNGTGSLGALDRYASLSCLLISAVQKQTPLSLLRSSDAWHAPDAVLVRLSWTRNALACTSHCKPLAPPKPVLDMHDVVICLPKPHNVSWTRALLPMLLQGR